MPSPTATEKGMTLRVATDVYEALRLRAFLERKSMTSLINMALEKEFLSTNTSRQDHQKAS